MSWFYVPISQLVSARKGGGELCTFRESKFLKTAIECISDPPNPEGFKKAVADFKTYRDLDKWKINMFAEILKNIEGDGEDLK